VCLAHSSHASVCTLLYPSSPAALHLRSRRVPGKYSPDDQCLLRLPAKYSTLVLPTPSAIPVSGCCHATLALPAVPIQPILAVVPMASTPCRPCLHPSPLALAALHICISGKNGNCGHAKASQRTSRSIGTTALEFRHWPLSALSVRVRWISAAVRPNGIPHSGSALRNQTFRQQRRPPQTRLAPLPVATGRPRRRSRRKGVGRGAASEPQRAERPRSKRAASASRGWGSGHSIFRHQRQPLRPHDCSACDHPASPSRGHMPLRAGIGRGVYAVRLLRLPRSLTHPTAAPYDSYTRMLASIQGPRRSPATMM
jgi:hypothetical protein